MISAIPQILEEKITQNGAMNIAEFMSICLYEPTHGYYMTRDPFGEFGDFTTAPEVTGLFGEILAAWLIDTWVKMGEPEPFNLVEMGPGRGTLMLDILETARPLSPAFYECAKVNLVEVSPFLKHLQEQRLEKHNVNWHNNIDTIDFSLPTIFIGNELLDAFPVRQFRRSAYGYIEQMVGLKKGEFRIRDDNTKIYNFETEIDRIEKPQAMEEFLTKLSKIMTKGVTLFIDYGAEVDTPFAPETLQALRRHKKVGILEHLGESDLTTHVNFTSVQNALGEGCTKAVPMGPWLTHLGLPVRAAAVRANLAEPEREELENQVLRLVHPEEMGTLFKAQAWQKGYSIPLEGF